MSFETDEPRQRTVAELLAQHGDSAATGRRRRRREPDGPEDDATPSPPVNGTAVGPRPIVAPRPAWPGLRHSPEPHSPGPHSPGPHSPGRHSPGPPPVDRDYRGWPDSIQDRPTERLPRYRDRGADRDDATGPIASAATIAGTDEHPARPGTEKRDGSVPDVGPAPAGRRAEPFDGGPPTQVGPADLDAPPAVLPEGPVDVEEVDDEEPRRLGRSAAAASPGQAWAVVLMQWILGAVGGAALWVGFRFLWRDLPVVAVAAAVVVTIGLVVVVRALLRNDDRRTTVSALLVGLLLTVSPALLVMLGR